MTQVAVALAVTGATAAFDGRRVLHSVDLDVREGECVAVMGRSGAGKSTLLHLLFAEKRDEIAFVPQAASLVQTLSVFHNVYAGRLDRHSTVANLRTLVWPTPREVAQVRDVLARVGLAEQIFQKAGSLSGGQQQRVSVARALYNGRPILIADEPVSALDRIQGSAVLRVMKSRHPTSVLALHDVHLAIEHADRIVVLEDGRKTVDAPSHTLTARDLLMRFGEIA
jgi:phosphonate transport system ATP-binding protein